MCVWGGGGGVMARDRRHVDDVRIQQQRPESPTISVTWHASIYKVDKLHQGHILQISVVVSLAASVTSARRC